jgi:hypothetical protein
MFIRISTGVVSAAAYKYFDAIKQADSSKIPSIEYMYIMQS